MGLAGRSASPRVLVRPGLSFWRSPCPSLGVRGNQDFYFEKLECSKQAALPAGGPPASCQKHCAKKVWVPSAHTSAPATNGRLEQTVLSERMIEPWFSPSAPSIEEERENRVVHLKAYDGFASISSSSHPQVRTNHISTAYSDCTNRKMMCHYLKSNRMYREVNELSIGTYST